MPSPAHFGSLSPAQQAARRELHQQEVRERLNWCLLRGLTPASEHVHRAPGNDANFLLGCGLELSQVPCARARHPARVQRHRRACRLVVVQCVQAPAAPRRQQHDFQAKEARAVRKGLHEAGPVLGRSVVETIFKMTMAERDERERASILAGM